MSVYIPDEWIWIVVVGFVLAFILCLGIGANDVANTFGTSVGAKVLTLRQACVLATIFETAGAVFLGAKVSETVRKGIIDVELYENNTEQFLLGNVAALGGSSIWLVLATAAKLPVSTTHSIVGATVGFALVANGASGIDWWGLGKIVISWFISPVLSGFITLGVYMLCDILILRKTDPLEPGLAFLPCFYGAVLVINLFSIVYEGPEMFGFDRIPLWGVFLISFGSGIVVALGVRFFMIPWQRRKIIDECTDLVESEKQEILFGTPTSNTTFGEDEKPRKRNSVVLKAYSNEGGFSADENSAYEKPNMNDQSANNIYTLPEPVDDKLAVEMAYTNGYSNGVPKGMDETHRQYSQDPEIEEVMVAPHIEVVKDRPENAKLFSFLQILTAIFGAFAHGGNDVSNGIGPLISIWLVASTQSIVTSSLTPLWILFYGGVGISVGLWIWGRRVIQTVGTNLSVVTPSSGFCIEIGAAMTVLLASNVGIPISSTHCKVGSIVFVGRARSKGNVDWSLFRNIFLSWVITLPATMGFSATIMALLQLTL